MLFSASGSHDFIYICIVKFIAIILSSYILLLNTVACGDEVVVQDEAQTEVVFQGELNHTHGLTDLCAPFCSCHCCHVHSVDFDAINFQSIHDEISSQIFIHFDNRGEEIPSPFFQPPRV